MNKSPQFWGKQFSDESKFCIFGIKVRKLVWKKQGMAFEKFTLVPTVKHGGGGIMIWGCMVASRVGRLTFIDSMYSDIPYYLIRRKFEAECTKFEPWR